METGLSLKTALVRKMNLEQIKKIVNSKCDTMLDEVIEKTIIKLKHRHHRSLNPYDIKDSVCSCDYCEYINKVYMPEKQKLQRLKRNDSRKAYTDDFKNDYYRCEKENHNSVIDGLKVMRSHYKKILEEL